MGFQTTGRGLYSASKFVLCGPQPLLKIIYVAYRLHNNLDG